MDEFNPKDCIIQPHEQYSCLDYELDYNENNNIKYRQQPKRIRFTNEDNEDNEFIWDDYESEKFFQTRRTHNN